MNKFKSYILFRTEGSPSKNEILEITSIRNLKVIEHVIPEAILLQASDQAIKRIKSSVSLKKWVVEELKSYPKPHSTSF